MTRKFKANSIISCFLIISLVLQPLVFEAALQAAEGDEQVKVVSESDKQVQDAKTQVNAIDTSEWKIDLNALEKFGIAFASLFKKKIKKDIKKAEKELAKGKTAMATTKTDLNKSAQDSSKASQDTKAAAATSQSAKDQSTIQNAAKKTTATQTALRGVGEMLQGVSSILSAAAMVIGLAGKGCMALSAIPYVGAVLGAVGSVLSAVAGVLTKIAAVIRAASVAVIAAANAAQFSEKDFKTFTSNAAAAWKNSGNEYFASSKNTGASATDETAAGSAKEVVKVDPDTSKPANEVPYEQGKTVVNEPAPADAVPDAAAKDVAPNQDKGDLVAPDAQDTKPKADGEVIEEPFMPNVNLQ
mgnify:CR=1 FL=1